MRILFAPLAWRSHYHPTAVFAWACRAAGHEVCVAAQPSVTRAIVESGLTPVIVGREYNLIDGVAEVDEKSRQLRGGRPMDPQAVFAMPPDVAKHVREVRITPHILAAEAMADDLLAFAEAWRPDLVVCDPAHLAAPLVTETRGIPLVRHLYGPDIGRIVGFPCVGSPLDTWPDALTKLYRRYGIRLAEEYAIATIDPTPTALQVPGIPNRVPMRYAPYAGAGELSEWLVAPVERPRVCVTWSTTARQSPAEGAPLDKVITALADLDAEIVLAMAQNPDLAPLDGSHARLRVACNLPHNLLFPSCSAVLHHGGAGTLLTAAYYGVPQVIAGMQLDWVFNGNLLAEQGAGTSLQHDQAKDASTIAEAVERVLADDTFRAAAARLRNDMLALPSAAETVPVLERLVS
jgi:UDP:flavonoid glycosyltransferase YjiC (YdhE family)